MALVKKLTKIGNSWGVILSSEIMDISEIKPGVELQIEVLPQEIRIKPCITGDDLKDRRVAKATERFIKKYRDDLKRLAT